MPAGVEDLGGIGIRIIADASQIRKGFDKELAGFTSNPVKVPITIDDKGQIAELRRRLRELSVPIKVTASRESARELKRNLQTRIEGEGGIVVPVKVKQFTSGEATAVREQIINSIGVIEIPVVLRFPGGGSPGGGGAAGGGFFFGEGGPGGVPRAQGPVAPAAPAAGAPPTAAEAAAASTTGPVVGAKPPRRPRQRAGRFTQLENESDAQFQKRLRQMQSENEAIIEERGTDVSSGRRAYNRNIVIRRKLGEEGPSTRLPTPSPGQAPYPRRIDAAGRIVRGPPAVGPEVTELQSRRGQTAEGVAAGQASLAGQFAESRLLQQAFGIEFDEEGNVTNINERGGRGGLRAGGIERATRGKTTGFRGSRLTASVLSSGGTLTAKEREEARIANVTRIAAEQQPEESVQEQIKRLHPTRGAQGRFLSKADRGALRAEELERLLGPEFGTANAALESGDLPTALRTAGGARAQLLGRLFGNQVDLGRGVGKSGKLLGGPALAKRILDPKRADLGNRSTSQEADVVLQMDALNSVMKEVYRLHDEANAAANRSEAGRKGAATRRGETTGQRLVGGRREQAEAHARFRQGMQYEPVVRGAPLEPEPTVTQAAAGQPPALAPGFVSGMGEGGEGGGGFFQLFGGGQGGPIPVEVVNFPEWMSSQQSRAAGPIGPAIGNVGTIPIDEIARQVAEHEATVGPVVPAKGRASRAKRAPAAPKRPQRVTPVTRPSQIAEQLGQAGALSEEDVEAILQPLAPRPPSRLAQARQDIQLQLAEARQGLPIRGAPVSVAQLVAGPARGKATARFSLAEQELGRAEQVERGSSVIRTNLELQAKAYDNINRKKEQGGKLTKAESALQKSLVDDIQEGAVALEERDKVQQSLVTHAADLAKLTTGEKVANLGKSFAGSLAGLTAFSAALGATTAVIGVAGVALGDYLERSSGYLLATQQITGALSDQTKASGGAVQQTVAQAAAQAHLSQEQYSGVSASLEQRAAVEASNKAFDEQLKIIEASRNVGRDQRGGFDQGLFQTTGGILGTPLLGTPSTGELVGREIQAAGRDLQRSRSPQQITGGMRAPVTFPGAGGPERAADMDAAFASYTERLDDLNDRFEGTGLRFVAALEDTPDAVTEGMARAFDDAGFGDVGTQIRAGNVAVPQGTDLDPERLATAFAIAAERNARPDPRVLLTGLEERVIPALQFQVRQNLKDQLETFIPAQRGIQFLAQPQAPFARGLVPGGTAPSPGLNIPGQAPGQFGGVPTSARESFRQYEQEATAAIDAINAKAAEGERVLAEKLGVPESTIAELRGFGERIGEINQQQADIRLDLQFTQYNRQLFLAKRTLGDLAALTGREGGTFIGQLQRQDLLLSRRSQSLSLQSQQLGLQTQQLQMQSSEIGQQQNMLQLQLAQRRVNFQVAAAGFTAPGTTPEERAARIDEAKIEATFAQREIDFQRQQLGIQQKTLAINREQFGIQQQSVGLAQQQFATQIALQDALNNRAFEDQAAAIAEMQKAFAASQQLQALENLKQVITTQRDLFVQELEAQVAAEEEFVKAQAQFSADLMSQTGEFVETTVNQVATVFNRAAAAFAQSSLGRFLNVPQAENINRDLYPESGVGPGRAEGHTGTYSTPTTMTVGEAGTEEVAILRNPRRMFLGGTGGSGSTNIFISITGNEIQADDDSSLAKMADRLANMVEERLGRRSRAFGLGSQR